MTTYNPRQKAHYQILRKMLVEAREQKAWFQKDLALKLGKDQAFVSKLENGERRLDWVEVLSLVEVLELDEVQFLKDYRDMVTAANEMTNASVLQEIAAREAIQAKAQAEIERIMREHNLSYSDLQKPAPKSKKLKKPK